MNELHEKAFMIIAQVGAAKSCYVEAMNLARENKFDEANAIIEEGNQSYILAHKEHHDLVTREASGEDININLIFMHAEDQLLNTETLKIMALEMIELNKKIAK